MAEDENKNLSRLTKLEKKIDAVINEKVWWREEREETLDRIEKLEKGEKVLVSDVHEYKKMTKKLERIQNSIILKTDEISELKEQLGAKDGDSKCSKCIYNFPKFIFWCEKCRDYSEFNPGLLNDGEKSVRKTAGSIPLASGEGSPSEDTDSTPSKCEGCDAYNLECASECEDMFNNVSLRCEKELPEDVYITTPICQEKEVIVEKADLEEQILNMDWLLNEMYATHYNTELYIQIHTEYREFRKKYGEA